MSSRIHPLGAVSQIGGWSDVTASHLTLTDYHKGLRVDWRIILKLIVKEHSVRTWTCRSFQLDCSESITNCWGPWTASWVNVTSEERPRSSSQMHGVAAINRTAMKREHLRENVARSVFLARLPTAVTSDCLRFHQAGLIPWWQWKWCW